MFSEKAKKHADACRFCWMCRHLCPVQLVTGKETNTPRAKGLQVSLIERGAAVIHRDQESLGPCVVALFARYLADRTDVPAHPAKSAGIRLF